MSLFDPPMRLQFTPEEAVIFERPIEGNGGAQRLLRLLHTEYDPTSRVLVVELMTLEKVMRYTYPNGDGGYERRFRVVIDAARRAGWNA